MSLGTIVLGLLNGLTVGLLAVGLVLVYRSNRFLNLAHAQLGTLSALLLAKWVLDWGWSWWLAFVLAVAVGVLTGLVTERFVVARLRRSGGAPVRLLLASVAMAQVLLAVTYIPAVSPNTAKAALYPEPFHSHLRIGHVILSGSAVLTAVLVPVLVLALAAFLRYSRLGKTIRAAANNPDAARLCGISVSRVSALSWGLAGGMSAVSAVLQAPSQANFSVATLGPYLLMLTLGAAAFGAFVSLPAALGGGVVLGLVSQIVAAETSNADKAEVAVFIVILIVVLVRGRAMAAAFSTSTGVADNPPALRIPPALASSPLVRYQRLWLGAVAVFAALEIPRLPWFDSHGNQFLLTLILIYAVLGVALSILVGWAGQVSLGHFALVGLGAYVAARFVSHDWSLPGLLVVAGLVGAAVMVVIGLPALRVGGLALAVTTTGFAVVSADWLYRQGWAGSSQPFVNVPPIHLGYDLGTPRSQLAVYYLALVVLVGAVAMAGSLRRLGPGRLVVAVRDNEGAVAAFGMNPATIKLTILAVSGFITAAAGVLWADAWHVASPDQFPANLSVAILALPVIGGLGSIGGAVTASVMLYSATFFLGPKVSSLFGSYGQNLGFQLFLAGAGQLAVLLSYPTGLAGIGRGWWQRYLDRRALVVAEWAPMAVVDRAGPGLRPRNVIAPLPAPVRPDPPAPARDEPAVLVTEGIRVTFGGIIALSSPDLELRAGEIVGLIGPNGAGKTTLMNVISGTLRPDRGSVKASGREIADLPADLRAAYGIARTFQDARLFAGLTVVETIQVALSYRRKAGVIPAMVAAPWTRGTEAASRAEADRICARFGLSAWADTATSDLSTGTRRICDLAAQVAARPRILLLDEPTAGVAQREAEEFGPLLRRIRDELDCTILIVEHDMPLLMSLCDRVYAMEAGMVIAEGTPDEVRRNARVVASYLGTDEAAIARSGTDHSPLPAKLAPRPRKVSAPKKAAPVQKAARKATINPVSAQESTQ